MRTAACTAVVLAACSAGCGYDLDAFSAVDGAANDGAADAVTDGAADTTVADTALDGAVVDAATDTLQDDPGVDFTACKLAAGYPACIRCCVDRLPTGAKKVWQQAGDCFCNGAHCKASCAAVCSARSYAGAEDGCIGCLGDALVGTCGKTLTAGKQLRNCVAACPGATPG